MPKGEWRRHNDRIYVTRAQPSMPCKAVTSNLFQHEDHLCKICFLSQTAHLTDHSQRYYEMIISSLFYLGIPCTVFVLTCFVMRGCFGKMYTCIYCVLYCLYCVFVLFRLCIFIICFVCTSVRTTATEWQLNCR